MCECVRIGFDMQILIGSFECNNNNNNEEEEKHKEHMKIVCLDLGGGKLI